MLFERMLERDSDSINILASIECHIEVLLNDYRLDNFVTGDDALPSLHNYGAPAYWLMHYASWHDYQYYCQALQKMLSQHEPRLCDVSVSLLPHDSTDFFIGIVIRARLIPRLSGKKVEWTSRLSPLSKRLEIQ